MTDVRMLVRGVGAAAFILTAAGCSGAEAVMPPKPPPEPIELVVLHTNDNWGETKPCG